MVAGLSVPVVQDSADLNVDTGRQRNQASPDAFGAAQGRAAGAVAQGLDKIAEVASEKDDEFSAAEAQDRANQLSARIRERLYNTDTGYLSTQRGLNALNGRGQVEADLEGFANELAPANPRAALVYRQAAQARVADALGAVATHSAQENTNYQNTVAEAHLQESTDNAVAAYGDPARVAANIDSGIAEIQRVGTLNGWGPDVVANRVRRFQSDVTQRVIVALATTDPQAAEEMYARIRPTMTAQDAAETLTTMRAAQAQAREQVTGAIWQAEANGQDPRSLPEWQAFTSNPLFGREHEQFNQYRRERARQAASGTTIPDNSAAYWAMNALSQTNPQQFQEMLPTFLAQGAVSRGDTGRLLQRSLDIRQGGGANGQAQIFNAVRSVAAPLVGRYGLDLSPPNGSTGTTAQNRARAFDGALAQVVQAFVEQSGGRQPNPEETQHLIGQAIIRMRGAQVEGMEAGTGTEGFRVNGVRGREGAGTEAVVPRAIMLDSDVQRMHRRLARLGVTNITRGAVETAYANDLAGIPPVPYARINPAVRQRIQQRLAEQQPGAPVSQRDVEQAYAAILDAPQ